MKIIEMLNHWHDNGHLIMVYKGPTFNKEDN